MKLTDAENHKKLTVIELHNTPYEERLRILGFREGCEVCPLMNNGSSMVVGVDNCRYAIGKEITDCILVEQLPPL